jgi:hypothetical protein
VVRDLFGNRGIDGRIILKYLCKKLVLKMFIDLVQDKGKWWTSVMIIMNLEIKRN